MPAEKIIGVDFGTSTSVIRVKRYQDGEPVGGRLEKMEVRFSGSAMAPTAVQRLPSGESVYFGYDAEIPHKKLNTQSYFNFKMELESPDLAVREQARSLTRDYFAYLGREYLAQRDGGHLGEIDDTERTIVSYPVKWEDKDVRDFLIQAAIDAGFPNVEGLDEARAAIQAVTVQSAHLLRQKGYFKAGVPVTILLMDMGAGTTDLVLCRHTPGDSPKTDVLATWPREDGVLFGGREADELLREYIRQALPRDIADDAINRVDLANFKAWKENPLSGELKDRKTVDYFAALETILNEMRIEAAYAIDRERFENYAEGYLRQLPQLINGCLAAGGVSGDEVDLVILTGGHSQWYFVPEILTGDLARFGEVGLTKIQADYGRVIPITLPQETVALGLVFQGLETGSAAQTQEDGPEAVQNESGVFPLTYAPYSRLRPVIATSGRHVVGVRQDGTVVTIGYSIASLGLYGADKWWDVVSVAATPWETVGLKKDGTVLTTGNNDHVSAWRDIISIAANFIHTVGLKKDGTVLTTGVDESGSCQVDGWRDIISIAAGRHHTVGLKKDGTVVAAGDNSSGQCDVGGWRDVAAIVARNEYTIGIQKNGSILLAGKIEVQPRDVNHWCWQDLVDMIVEDNFIVGLKKDGAVVIAGGYEDNKFDGGLLSGLLFDEWLYASPEQHRKNNNIVRKLLRLYYGEAWQPEDPFPLEYDYRSLIRPVIAAGAEHTLGVKSDGSVLAVGDNVWGQCDVSLWRDVVSVAAAGDHSLGLRKDGTVLVTGANEDIQRSISAWRDIIAVATGKLHAVGLRRDGTVVAVGSNYYGQCQVLGWRDIVAIAAGDSHTLGLKKDGTVVAVGSNGYGECNTSYEDNVAAIAAGYTHSVCLFKDGTVKILRRDHGQSDLYDTQDWKNIVAIAAGGCYTAALKNTGSVVTHFYDPSKSSSGIDSIALSYNWNVQAIAVGKEHIVGLCGDGTVVSVGDNEQGQCNVGRWVKEPTPTLFGLKLRLKTWKPDWKLF